MISNSDRKKTPKLDKLVAELSEMIQPALKEYLIYLDTYLFSETYTMNLIHIINYIECVLIRRLTEFPDIFGYIHKNIIKHAANQLKYSITDLDNNFYQISRKYNFTPDTKYIVNSLKADITLILSNYYTFNYEMYIGLTDDVKSELIEYFRDKCTLTFEPGHIVIKKL